MQFTIDCKVKYDVSGLKLSVNGKVMNVISMHAEMESAHHPSIPAAKAEQGAATVLAGRSEHCLTVLRPNTSGIP